MARSIYDRSGMPLLTYFDIVLISVVACLFSLLLHVMIQYNSLDTAIFFYFPINHAGSYLNHQSCKYFSVHHVNYIADFRFSYKTLFFKLLVPTFLMTDDKREMVVMINRMF